MTFLRPFTAALIVLVSMTPAARAEIAVFIEPGAFDDIFPAGGSMHGWQFSVTAPIEVTHLGLYDEFLDGFLQPHPMGIWDGDGNLVVGAMISAGTINPLIDNFRYVELNATAAGDVILTPGEQYTIGFYSEQTLQGEGMVIFDGSHTIHPTIDYVGSVSDLTFEFTEPLTPDPDGLHRFGPNFQFIAVPLPASSILLGVALVAGTRRRRGR